MSVQLNEDFFKKINNKIIKKKIMGSCDNCSKLLYTGDEIYRNIELKHTHFNLEFCNESCYHTKGINYPFIKDYSYEYILIKEKDISNSLSTLFLFMLKYPWTLIWSIRYGSTSILEYMIKIQNKEKLDDYEKLFLENCKKYNMI
jgi:hypothetical protein